MPTPTAITDLSQTAGSNWPAGSNAPSVLDDTQRAHASFIAQLRDGKGFTSAVTLSSGATTDIGAQDSFFINVSGTATVTSFGTTYNGPRFIRFTGTPTLTHNATTLICPGAANITTVAGDTCIVVPTGSGWAIASYQRADGTALSSSSVTDYLNSTRIDVASASTVNLTSSAPNTRHINITGTTAITGFTVAVGQCYFVRFADALTLTNNSAIVTNKGANITTEAGATAIIRATASNTVEIVCYTPVTVTATHLAGGGAGQIPYQTASGVTAMLAAGTAGQVLQSNGTSAPSWSSANGYAVQAWVNFNGTGTVAIRASGNVSSITDNGAGDYTVNFSTAMPDVNYTAIGNAAISGSQPRTINPFSTSTGSQAPLTTSFRVVCNYPGFGLDDSAYINIAVIR